MPASTANERIGARDLLHSISGHATSRMLSQGTLLSMGDQRRPPRSSRQQQQRPPPSSASSSDTDEDLDDRASALLRQMSRQTSVHTPSISVAASRQLLLVHQTPPQSRPATAASTLNTSLLEESLRQQTAALILQQQREIEAHRDTLQQALDEVHRIREAEEGVLTQRIDAARGALSQQMAELQLQYQQQARQLENRADEYVAQQRRATKAAVEEGVRRISSALASPRTATSPAGAGALPRGGGGGGASATPGYAGSASWGAQLPSPDSPYGGQYEGQYGRQYETSAPPVPRSAGGRATASPADGLRSSPAGGFSPSWSSATARTASQAAAAEPATPIRCLSDEFSLLADQHRTSFISPQPHSAHASSWQAPSPSPDTPVPWQPPSLHNSLSRPFSSTSWRSPPPASSSAPWAGAATSPRPAGKPRPAPRPADGALSASSSPRPRPHTPVRGARLLGLGRRVVEVEALHRAVPRALDLLAEALDN